MTGRATVVIVLVALGACSTRAVTPQVPTPTPQGPSQTELEAKRDGVPLKVAALTLSDRIRGASASTTSDEGVWILAAPRVIPGYGEVLLLDARREQVIKAIPLTDGPSKTLVVDDSYVWVLDRDRTWTRIDRRTFEISARRTSAPSSEASRGSPSPRR